MIKRCEMCQEEFNSTTSRGLYCPECVKIRDNEAKKRYEDKRKALKNIDVEKEADKLMGIVESKKPPILRGRVPAVEKEEFKNMGENIIYLVVADGGNKYFSSEIKAINEAMSGLKDVPLGELYHVDIIKIEVL